MTIRHVGVEVQLHSFFTSALNGSGQPYTPAPATLPPGKQPRHPLNQMLDWPQSQSGDFGEEKNLLSLSRFKPRINQSMAQPLFNERTSRNNSSYLNHTLPMYDTGGSGDLNRVVAISSAAFMYSLIACNSKMIQI